MSKSRQKASAGVQESVGPTGHQDKVEAYNLDQQVGFILRRVHQRASAIFAAHFREAGLSPVQFSCLTKIRDEGRVSQNQLGRMISVDPATIMGVVGRMAKRGLIRRLEEPGDRRRTALAITSEGLRLVEDCEQLGFAVTAETLEPLDEHERATLLDLLNRLT